MPFVTDGAGFIAIVIAMLARGRPYLGVVRWRCCSACRSRSRRRCSSSASTIPTGFVFMLPFVSVIVVLIIFARQSRLPAALGLPYHRGSR